MRIPVRCISVGVIVFLAVPGYAHKAKYDRVEALALQGNTVVLEIFEYILPSSSQYENLLKDMDANRDGIIDAGEAREMARMRGLKNLLMVEVVLDGRRVNLKHVASEAEEFPEELRRGGPLAFWHRYEGGVQSLKCQSITIREGNIFRRALVRISAEGHCHLLDKRGNVVKAGALTEVFEPRKRKITMFLVEEKP